MQGNETHQIFEIETMRRDWREEDEEQEKGKGGGGGNSNEIKYITCLGKKKYGERI